MDAKVFKNVVAGKPAKLVDSIEYDKNGIGRNLLLGNKKVTMINFAFSEEKGLVTSESQGDILIYVTEGVLEVDLDGKEFSVKQGEFVVLPKGLPHSLETDEKTKVLFLLAYEDEEIEEGEDGAESAENSDEEKE